MVKRGECAFMFDGERQQVGISNLVVAHDACPIQHFFVSQA
jgi:hypothetical protein